MAHWLDKVVEILKADTADLRELALIAGYDLADFYRGTVLAGADLTGQDLAGMRFRDFDGAPEMIVVPDGTFLMGSLEGEGGDGERPQHRVTIKGPFAVSIAPINRSEFAAFIRVTNYKNQKGAVVLKKDGNWGE